MTLSDRLRAVARRILTAPPASWPAAPSSASTRTTGPTPGPAALAAARQLLDGQPVTGRRIDAAATGAGVTRSALHHAARVLAAAPDLAAAVERGDMSLHCAFRLVQVRQRDPRRAATIEAITDPHCRALAAEAAARLVLAREREHRELPPA